ncbi:hypothetical protein SAMN05444157_1029 [Frankineae bacterium MT45]|nr:hypothetical protein SAMN05444157_1029 [Frankineae bacterium MT45]
MRTPLQPIDAAALQRYRQQLQQSSSVLRTRAGDLRRLAQLPRWESTAARLYEDVVHREARLLAAVAERLLDAAEILRRHIDTATHREAELAAAAKATAAAAGGLAAAAGDAIRGSVAPVARSVLRDIDGAMP